MESKSINIHQAIIDRCRKGDRKAQRELFDLYYKAMYNTALRLMQDEDQAKDVVQESFIAAFGKLDQYRGDSTFGAWLKRIVINKGLNEMKKNQKWVEMDETMDVADPYYAWEDLPDHSLTIKGIKSAIGALSPGFRSVLTLYLFEGYDHKEIAGILNISESTSKSQYNRAKKKIRTYLSQEVKYG